MIAMSHDLQPRFEQYVSGAISTDAFCHELLTLCKAQPERAWESLALLDQYFRRGKISAELLQSLRQRIGRQALGIESYRPAKAPARAALPVASEIDAEDSTIETLPPEAAAPSPSVAATPPPAPPAAPAANVAQPLAAPPAAPPAAPASAARSTEFARAEERQKPEDAGRVWPAAHSTASAPIAKGGAEAARSGKPAGAASAMRFGAGSRWRPYFRTFPAIALAAVVLAVAATPTVREGVGDAPTADAVAGTGAPFDGATGAANDTTTGQAERTPAMLALSSERYVVEGDRAVAELSVERSPDASGETSFLWWTEAAGARPDQDFVGGAPRRAQMADGVNSVKLRIPILANPNRRHIEMFYVLIGKPSGDTTLGPIRRAAVFILPLRVP